MGTGVLDGKGGLRGGGQISAYDEDDIRKVAESNFAEQKFLSPGDEVKIRTGKPYTYEDGRVERTGGMELGVKLDNFRLVDEISKGDPDAPADHPTHKDHKTGTWLCYDLTGRIIGADEKVKAGLEASSAEKLKSAMKEFNSGFKAGVQPIIDDSRSGLTLTDSYDVEVPPGSGTPLQRVYETGMPNVVDERDKAVFDETTNSLVTSKCVAVTGPAADESNDLDLGTTVSEQADIPEGVTGFTFTPSLDHVESYDAEPNWFTEVSGWRADL
ncbi:hypothetical protein [Corynebacterium flavescens]|uniref:hypothetical protein n=1 Tax=Corynebacterium flavescens TaxID=28028 RepID=UPI00264933D2|nr:hypothetical protein [Corynebacterium flavescens]MDN6100177.1 hypothetical protein [Corynebacterium flavescens]MDN6236059.1 hypothetical protein [Corynebacterium flavescens]MDN6431030.1 hypothetical protein [Corynebacterium flavescens]MDN6474793.1 hypothetical protein [Corynebacterium flavescens]MDN6822407.1 hypothetical protein [Corynebacterium flavescens]